VREAEADAREGAYAAIAGRADDLVVDAWTDLMYIVGYEEARPVEARELARQADAFLRRLPHRRLDLEAKLAEGLSAIAERERDFDQAVAQGERAVALTEQFYGPNDTHVGTQLSNLATVIEKRDLWSPDAFARALELLERERRILELNRGPQHPDMADLEFNVGVAWGGMRHLDEAEKHYRRALTLGEATLGPEHASIAWYLVALSEVRHLAGDDVQALALAERALRIRIAALGEDHVDLAEAHGHACDALLGLGRDAEALTHCKRAVAIARAAEIKIPALLDYTCGVAEAEWGLGRHAEAAASFERTYQVASEFELAAPAVQLACARFGEARVLWERGQHARARALAIESRDGWAMVPSHFGISARRVDAWLAAHR
jgi:tetratricopeptide (TPR) repeat protein